MEKMRDKDEKSNGGGTNAGAGRPSMPTLSSRIQGALWGLIVGDALGVPVEFRSRSELEEDPVEDMRGWKVHQQPPGTWSDDSSLTLCTVDSILKTGWNLGDMGKRFCQWLYEGYLTPYGKVFDVGGTTKLALARVRMGTPPVEAGGRSEMDNGNGSLMRILPVALYFAEAPFPMLLQAVSDTSSLTHAHPRSRLACILYSLCLGEVLKGRSIPQAVKIVAETLSSPSTRRILSPALSGELPTFSRVLTGAVIGCARDEISSGGYVVDTLEASLWCVATSDSFSEAVLKAVNLGKDTDTTGAVAGGLAGAYWGVESIPSRWIEILARKEEIFRLIESFTRMLTQAVPFPDSYWVLPGKVLAGEYPRTKEEDASQAKLSNLLECGITSLVDLTEENERHSGIPLKPYHRMIEQLAAEKGKKVRVTRFPIPDGGTVEERSMQEIHRFIDTSLERGDSVYIHCWGGHGRTGLVVGTWLVHAGLVSGKDAIESIRFLRRKMEDAYYPSPETVHQVRMVEQWRDF